MKKPGMKPGGIPLLGRAQGGKARSQLRPMVIIPCKQCQVKLLRAAAEILQLEVGQKTTSLFAPSFKKYFASSYTAAIAKSQ